MKKLFLTAVFGLFCLVNALFAGNPIAGTYSGQLSMSGNIDLGRGNVDIYPGSTDNHVTFVLPDFPLYLPALCPFFHGRTFFLRILCFTSHYACA